MRPRLALIALLLALTTVASGCGLLSRGAYDAPLPGGADLGSSPYTLRAEFSDVLDLVRQSSVKVDDVPVGQVTDIELAPDGRSATVTMAVNDAVRLPEGTTARVEQTTLLGEKYVALVRPEGSAADAALLGDGDVLALPATSQAVEVEQVLGALSVLLNGGGLGQFQEIAQELTAVSAGRPAEIREALRQVDTFVTQLDERRGSIVTALDGLDRLGRALEQDRDKITVALEDLEPGLAVLADQREELVRMLTALDRLSTVTVRTLDAAGDDIERDFELLAPILKELAAAGSALPESLEVLVTFPFPDSVLTAVNGDYIDTFLTLNLRSQTSAQPEQPQPQAPEASARAGALSSLVPLLGAETGGQ